MNINEIEINLLQIEVVKEMQIETLKKYFLLSLRSSEGAVAISALMVLRPPRRSAFAKLLMMT